MSINRKMSGLSYNGFSIDYLSNYKNKRKELRLNYGHNNQIKNEEIPNWLIAFDYINKEETYVKERRKLNSG